MSVSGTLDDLASVASRLAKLRARRDELIAQARAEGETLRTIAGSADLSNPGVLAVLRRLDAPDPDEGK